MLTSPTDTPAPAPDATPRRTDGLTLVSVWHFLAGGFYFLVGMVMLFPTFIFGTEAMNNATADLVLFTGIVGLITIAFFALSLLNLIIGYGVWSLRAWGRIGAIALALVGLIFLPIGTVIGALCIWYLLKPEIAQRFERTPAA